MRGFIALSLLLLSAAPAPSPTRYLVAWAMESKDPSKTTGRDFMMATKDSAKTMGRDFLAVFNVTPGTGEYGRLVAMVPVGTHAQMAHHTNYDMPQDGVLFANDYMAGRTYVFNLRNPAKPNLVATFGDAGPYTHPHSFAQLADGNTLATYQFKGAPDQAAGALVELDGNGRAIRSSAAAAPSVDPFIRPYSLEVVPKLDRVVTTSSDMLPNTQFSRVVQVWRLSDLKLLKTVLLRSPPHKDVVARDAVEARLLADGKTVLVATGGCGLYRINDLAGSNPSAQFVYDFGYRSCGVPTVVGNFWVEAMMSGHSVTSLNVSDPSKPVEAGHIAFKGDAYPHWIAREPAANRIVITGFGSISTQAFFATIDQQTGALSLDPNAIEFDRKWPDGWDGRAIPHGAVFSN